MSVRAYIVREKMIWVNEDAGFFQYDNNGENLTKYVHKDQEYCFSCWSQNHIRQLILDYGGDDYTNCDSVGEIEISIDDFKELYENESFDDPEDQESIEKIKKYFDEGNYYLTLNCW